MSASRRKACQTVLYTPGPALMRESRDIGTVRSVLAHRGTVAAYKSLGNQAHGCPGKKSASIIGWYLVGGVLATLNDGGYLRDIK